MDTKIQKLDLFTLFFMLICNMIALLRSASVVLILTIFCMASSFEINERCVIIAYIISMILSIYSIRTCIKVFKHNNDKCRYQCLMKCSLGILATALTTILSMVWMKNLDSIIVALSFVFILMSITHYMRYKLKFVNESLYNKETEVDNKDCK